MYSVAKKPTVVLGITRVRSLDKAVQLFGQEISGIIPLVAVIHDPLSQVKCFSSCGFSMQSIPTGIYCIATRFGKSIGVLPPGLHFMPPWVKVQYAVTQHYIPFVIPVQACPTKDNVYVTIEMMIVFRILDAEKFLYQLGPSKLETLIISFVEEGIRGLAYATEHLDVLDLRGRRDDSFITELNVTLMKFGVEVHSAAISSVKLPTLLAQSLEQATFYSSKMNEHIKEHRFDELVRMDMETLKSEQQIKDCISAMERATQLRDMAMLRKELEELDAIIAKEVAEINVETESTVNIIAARSDLEVAKFDGQRGVQNVVLSAQGQSDAARIHAEQQAVCMEIDANSRLVESTQLAEQSKHLSAAEGQVSRVMRSKREFERRKELLEVLNALAGNMRVRVSGSSSGVPVAQLVGLGAVSSSGSVESKYSGGGFSSTPIDTGSVKVTLSADATSIPRSTLVAGPNTAQRR